MDSYEQGVLTIYNADCMDIMAQYDDNYFDLAVVDPPYGIERFKKPSGSTRFGSSEIMQKNGLTWDKKPNKKYFEQLFRVSKNQLIWGANNFQLPPTEYFCIWNKQQTVNNFASAEYCWVSMGLKKPAKVFKYSIHKHNQIAKIHPTQKPVPLYAWIYENYAEPGQRIIDTHLGSGSNAIAAHYAKMGEFVGIELDPDYYKASIERIKKETRQFSLF